MDYAISPKNDPRIPPQSRPRAPPGNSNARIEFGIPENPRVTSLDRFSCTLPFLPQFTPRAPPQSHPRAPTGNSNARIEFGSAENPRVTISERFFRVSSRSYNGASNDAIGKCIFRPRRHFSKNSGTRRCRLFSWDLPEHNAENRISISAGSQNFRYFS